MAKDSEFIPITELDAERFEIPVPSYVAEEIGINAGRLAAMAAMGGFREDIRITSTDEERTARCAVIAGWGGGVATASRITTQRAVKGRGQYDSDDDTFRPSPLLTVQLSATAIKERVQDASKHVRDPEPWAREIDKTLRGCVHRAAWRHMVGTLPPAPQIGTNLMGLSGVGLHLWLTQVDMAALLSSAIGALFVGSVNVQPAIQTLRGHVRSFREAHFSLLPILHIDRALGATIMAASAKVAKHLSQ